MGYPTNTENSKCLCIKTVFHPKVNFDYGVEYEYYIYDNKYVVTSNKIDYIKMFNKNEFDIHFCSNFTTKHKDNRTDVVRLTGHNKTKSVLMKRINTIKRKWLKDQKKVRLLKHESRQLHHLCDKLISEGRLTLDELRENVNSREESKKLFGYE